MSLNKNPISSVACKLFMFLFVFTVNLTVVAKPISEDSLSKDTTFLKIGFVGDIMAHQTQLNAQKKSDGSYDFNDNYYWMAPFFKENDIMIGNVETTFAGKKLGFSAYPRFNTPDELANALSNAGFNVVSTANNHMYDTGGDGLYRTLKVLRDEGLNVTGSRMNTDEKRYVIKEVNGVRAGILAYTYESGRTENGVITINGIHIKHADTSNINTFDPWNLAPGVQEMRTEIKTMKELDSVDLTIAVMHWGDEYKTLPNDYQKALADSLNKLKFDLVLGSHPHVVQPMDVIYDSTENHKTYVLYSAGNFISNQRYETLKDYNTEDGVYVTIECKKVGDNPVVISKIEHHPTWVNRFKENGKYNYQIVPVNHILSQEDLKEQFTPQQLERIKASQERTTETLYKFKTGY